MKSNINTLFEAILPRLKASKDVDIDEVLDELMPLVIFKERVSKMQMAREIIRGRLTSEMNAEHIYSFAKGHFVWIENANEEQLQYFKEKAKRDAEAAEKRKSKAEELMMQISMAWDEDGKFIGLHIPKVVNE